MARKDAKAFFNVETMMLISHRATQQLLLLLHINDEEDF